MPHRFCAICGKSINEKEPHFGMCLNCFLKENPLFRFPDKFDVKICIDCGSYSKKEEWFQSKKKDVLFSVEEALHKFLIDTANKEKEIEFSLFIDEKSFIYSSNDLLKSLEIIIEGFLKKDTSIKFQQKIKVIISNELCKNCLNLRGGNYYLSIIQLRVINESHFDIIKNVLEKIQAYVESQFEKDPKQYITKIIDQKYGIDLYLSTKEMMNHIITYLRKNHHFMLKRTKKLVGRDIQRGKNIFRLKSLIKFLPINKNDCILIENDIYTVENITKKKVVLRNNNNQKLVKEYSYFFKIKYK